MRFVIYPVIAAMLMISAAAQAEETRAIRQVMPVATPENTAKPGSQNSKNMGGGSARVIDSEFKHSGPSVTFPESEFKQEGSSITVHDSEFKQTDSPKLRPQTKPASGVGTKEPIGEMPQEHKDKIAACESTCAAEVNKKPSLGDKYSSVGSNFTPPDPCSKVFYSEESCTPELKKKYDEKQTKKKACFEKCMKNIPNPAKGLAAPF